MYVGVYAGVGIGLVEVLYALNIAMHFSMLPSINDIIRVGSTIAFSLLSDISLIIIILQVISVIIKTK